MREPVARGLHLLLSDWITAQVVWRNVADIATVLGHTYSIWTICTGRTRLFFWRLTQEVDLGLSLETPGRCSEVPLLDGSKKKP